MSITCIKRNKDYKKRKLIFYDDKRKICNKIINVFKRYQVDTYKDIVFWCICFIWLIGNFVECIITGHVIINNMMLIFIMCIVNLVKLYNIRFNNWLNTPLFNKK